MDERPVTPPSIRKTRPLRIGLSPRILHHPPAELGFRNKTLQYLEQTIAHWIMRHHALAFMLPTLETGGTERASVGMSDYVSEIDGLVLQGGADMSPSSYGEIPLRLEWSGDRMRDLYEIDLFRVRASGKAGAGSVPRVTTDQCGNGREPASRHRHRLPTRNSSCRP